MFFSVLFLLGLSICIWQRYTSVLLCLCLCLLLLFPGCGGILRRPSANFTSPGYPRDYPTNTECEWTITVDWGHSVELTVEDFSMPNVPNCYGDSLTVSFLNCKVFLMKILYCQELCGGTLYVSWGMVTFTLTFTPQNCVCHFMTDKKNVID